MVSATLPELPCGPEPLKANVAPARMLVLHLSKAMAESFPGYALVGIVIGACNVITQPAKENADYLVLGFLLLVVIGFKMIKTWRNQPEVEKSSDPEAAMATVENLSKETLPSYNQALSGHGR
jgi:hypothetical protein